MKPVAIKSCTFAEVIEQAQAAAAEFEKLSPEEKKAAIEKRKKALAALGPMPGLVGFRIPPKR